MSALFASSLVNADPAAPALETGSVQSRTLSSDTALEYFLYIPKHGGSGARIFVDVHGISRNAAEHAKGFAALAECYGVVLVAPYFPEARFPDYQRLGREGRGLRADLALHQIIQEVGQLTGAKTDKLYLFGFSGGAQFVHRYSLAHPERVAKVVVGSAGWYTFPDDTRRYPKGIKSTPSLPDIQFYPSKFLTVPALVLVGERDVRRGAVLNKSEKLDQQQGLTRLDRGQHWAEAMAAAAKTRGLDTSYLFKTMPRAGHSFGRSMKRGDMGKTVFDFLFGESPAACLVDLDVG